MVRFTALLRWWLYLGLTVLGTVAAGYFGLFSEIYDADSTKLSFVMYAIFAVFTVLTGVNTKKACNNGATYEELCRFSRRAHFASSFLMGLGLIGTVVGFILMSKVSFVDLSMDNISSLKDALANMGGGISTALYTTAVGQVCGWVLRLQLIEFDEQLETLDDRCTCKAAEEDRIALDEAEDD